MNDSDISIAYDQASILIETVIRLGQYASPEDPDLSAFIEEAKGELRELAARFEHFADHARQLAGKEDFDDEPVVSAYTSFCTLDLRHILDRGKEKWNGPSRNRKKKGVCIHHTGIHPEMGAPRSVPDDWPGRIAMKSGHLVTDRMIRLCYRIAGQGDYSGQSYHGWSARGALILNLPFDFRTWHGDGANDDYAGYAIDYHSGKGKLENPAEERAKLRAFIAEMRDEEHPVTELTVHGAWAHKTIDPGAEVIREVMEPVANHMGLTILYDFKRPGCTSIREMLEAG